MAKKKTTTKPAATVTVKTTGAAPKKKRRSSKRGKRGKWTMEPLDIAIAAGTALLYGYMQNKVSKNTGKDDKPAESTWFAEAPVVTPLGRAGTWGGAAGITYHFTSWRPLKGISVGLGVCAALGIGRRGLELYDEAALKADTSLGGLPDDLALPRARTVVSEGVVDVDIT